MASDWAIENLGTVKSDRPQNITDVKTLEGNKHCTLDSNLPSASRLALFISFLKTEKNSVYLTKWFC